MKLITDPVYLSYQTISNVKDHQVGGLIPSIKNMMILCRSHQLIGLTAPEVGLPFNFFIAHDLSLKHSDFDTIFSPSLIPVGVEAKNTEEMSVSGDIYIVPRYLKVKMFWYHYTGELFEPRSNTFEGDISYMAQIFCERLSGYYVGSDDRYKFYSRPDM
jgi:peptide deformylase